MQTQALDPTLLTALSLMILVVALGMDKMPVFQWILMGLSFVGSFIALVSIVVRSRQQ